MWARRRWIYDVPWENRAFPTHLLGNSVEEPAMNRTMILNLLNQHRDEFMNRFGARHLALFGSAARDELRDDSDVDVLVEFDGPATFDRYVGLQTYLEALFGLKVDLATEAMIKPRLRRHIEKDLLRVA
jgi:predicted nucleotidyltransferase